MGLRIGSIRKKFDVSEHENKNCRKSDQMDND